MPRSVRKKSSTGIYHVIVRGINRQDIFHNDGDFKTFLEILSATKIISKFELYGYCLMNNHIHLLIYEKIEGISKIMERLGTRYANYYNFRYERDGHVFQNRFKSECVEDEKYLLSVIRYIHNNPVKAQMTDTPEKYKWSSCKCYFGLKEYPHNLTSKKFVLDIFSKEYLIAIEKFKAHMKEKTNEVFMECKSTKRKTNIEVYDEIEKLLNSNFEFRVKNMNKVEMQQIIKRIKGIEGISQRQIARVLGVPDYIVFTA